IKTSLLAAREQVSYLSPIEDMEVVSYEGSLSIRNRLREVEEIQARLQQAMSHPYDGVDQIHNPSYEEIQESFSCLREYQFLSEKRVSVLKELSSLQGIDNISLPDKPEKVDKISKAVGTVIGFQNRLKQANGEVSELETLLL